MLYQLVFSCKHCGNIFSFITKANTEKEEKLLDLPRTCIRCKALVKPVIIKLEKPLFTFQEIKNHNSTVNFLNLPFINLSPFEINIILDNLIIQGYSGIIKVTRNERPIYSIAVLPLENDYEEVKVKRRKNRNVAFI